MNSSILGFSLDDNQHWFAELACGHYQHVRHDPPLRVREWVLTPDGRASRVGKDLNCLKCDQGKPRDFPGRTR